MLLPSLENLACFDAAARTLNFRTAARAVALSPAAFGQRIKQIEEQVGAPLFDRTTRRVQLTPLGLAMLPRARQCLAIAEDCLRSAMSPAPAPVELTLGTRFELGMSWLVPQLGKLTRRRPEVTLHLYFGASDDLLRRLHDRSVDCVVTSARWSAANLAAETLHEERYAFVASPKLLQREEFSCPEHAARHCLLDIDATMPLFRYLADQMGGVGRFAFARHRWVGLGAAMKTLVLAGEGVAVLPLHMVAAELRGGKLQRLLRSAALARDHFRLVYRRDDPRSALYAKLAESLRAVPIQ
ncbi:LysR family transcriptional regulator [Sorangium cellulosum]|uniref:LysR family transcriptional regulator n=1 Tax=Sorangium cellulosum TaxID=56 RepID=A0A150PJC8_SORCE|nr:LysR family transcriptional regulator [Sorangium cellulosum]